MSNNVMLSIIAKLYKKLSEKCIQGDLKILDNKFHVKVLAKLSKTLAARELEKQINELNSLYVKVGTKFPEGTKEKIQNNIQMLQKQISDLEIGLKASGTQRERLHSEIRDLTKRLQSKINSKPLEYNLELKKNKVIADIEYLGKRYAKLFSNISASKKYENMLHNALSISDKGQLASTRAEIAAFTSELKTNGLASKSTGDRWRDLIDKSKDLFSAASIFRVIFSQVKQAVYTTVLLDKSFTDLIKAQDNLTRNDYTDYLAKCNKKAQKLATTQDALIKSVTEFSKSGYNLSESDALSERATKLANVGDMSASDSSKAIISGVQAYETIDGNDDVLNKADALIDKYNEMGNKANITTAEIAKGVQSVGSVFSDANTSVDEFIALLGAGNRQFQDADSLALGLRTAALRIHGCTTELEAMGEETDGVITSTTELADKIASLTNFDGNGGVKIFEDDEQTIRSIYAIFNDIGKVYKQMSNTDQNALLDIIAGKHRASGITAVLNNMTEAHKLLKDSLKSAGSAEKEYEKYMESAEAHMNQFKAKLIETYSEFMNGDTIKYTADFGTAMLDIFNKTDLLRHGLLAIASIRIGQGISTIGLSIADAAKQMTTLGNAMQKVKNLPTDSALKANVLTDVGKATKNLTEKNFKLLLSFKNLGEDERIAILRQHNLTEEESRAKLEKMGLITATKAQTTANAANTASTFTLSGAMKALKVSTVSTLNVIKAAFLSNPIGVALMAISTGISLISTLISSHNQKLEESRQKSVELTNVYKDQMSSLKSQIEKYKELGAKLDDENLSDNELRSIKEQLLTVQKELIDTFGQEVSNIDLVNGKYEEQLKLLSGITKEKAEQYVISNRDSYSEAKGELFKVRDWNLGTLGAEDWTSRLMGDEQKHIIDFLEQYENESVKVDKFKEKGTTFYSLKVEADAANAQAVLEQLSKDLEQFAKDNNIDLEDYIPLIQSNISTQIKNTQTDEFEQYKKIYEEFITADIVRNENLGPLYKEAIDAVEAYNKALSSGEGIETAKENLDSVKQSVNEVSDEVYGSQDVFDGIYNSINKDAEAAYNLSQSFENDDTVKEYAEQLKGLTDIDLKAIDFDNGNDEKGEKAFRNLMDVLELSKDDTQLLIDKLVELGYVKGEVTDGRTSTTEPIFTFSEENIQAIDEFRAKASTLQTALDNLESGKEFDLSKLYTEFPELVNSTDDLSTAIRLLLDNELSNLYHTLGENIPPNLADSLQDLAGKATDASLSVKETFSSIQKSFKVLNDFNTAMSEGMSDSVLSSVSSLSEELNTMVAGFYAGAVSAEQLYSALTEHYNHDLVNYSEALIAKNKFSNDFYNSVGMTNADVINQFKEDYGVDISNCKNYNSAKLEIERQTLTLIGGMWKKYYDTQSKTYTADMKRLFKEAQVEKASGVKDSDNDFLQSYYQIKEQAAAYERAVAGLDSIVYDGIESNFEKINSGLSANASASQKSSASITDNIKAYMDFMESSLETSKIDYQGYCISVSAYLKRMFDIGKLSAADYHSYIRQMLEYQLTVYDRALKAVTTRIDKEIDGIDALIDGMQQQNKALEQQKGDYDSILSVVSNVYDAEIKAIQDQQKAIDDKIQALRDANSEEERAIALQKAQYNLQRAMNQRTKRVYREGQGFVYEADNEAVNTAGQEVRDAEMAVTIAGLEQERDSMNASIESLEALKQKWMDISTVYDEEMRKQLAIAYFGRDYESVILSGRAEDIEAFQTVYLGIQSQINDNTEFIASYEEKKAYYSSLKEQWSAITGKYEEETNAQYAQMLLGQNWESNVLSGRIDTLDQFRDEYIRIQQEIAQAAWKAANEIILAAQQAEKGAKGQTGSAAGIGSTGNGVSGNDKKNPITAPETTYSVTDAAGKTKFDNLTYAQASDTISIYGKPDEWKIVKNTGKYARGGVVSTKLPGGSSLLDRIANRIGEDQMAAVTVGERILTPEQNRQFEKLVASMPSALRLADKISAPDMSRYDFRESGPQPFQFNIGEINLHEVQNTDALAKAIKRDFPMKMYREMMRRY